MERGSSKHGSRLDEEMEQETETLTRSGQPARTEEWLETEPVDESHLALPEDQRPGSPAGISPAEVNERSDIARSIEPHKLPADRDALLRHLDETGAPDEVVDAIRRLPAGRQFASVGEIARALGIHTER